MNENMPSLEKEATGLETSQTESKHKEAQHSERLKGDILIDFDSLRMRRFEYESIMKDIQKMNKAIKEMEANEEVFEADRQINSKWVPLARKALTEWVDSEIRFREEYGEEAKKKLDKGHPENPDFDALAMQYGITEYSPEERKLNS